MLPEKKLSVQHSSSKRNLRWPRSDLPRVTIQTRQILALTPTLHQISPFVRKQAKRQQVPVDARFKMITEGDVTLIVKHMGYLVSRLEMFDRTDLEGRRRDGTSHQLSSLGRWKILC
jgi:hypothetical protein